MVAGVVRGRGRGYTHQTMGTGTITLWWYALCCLFVTVFVVATTVLVAAGERKRRRRRELAKGHRADAPP